MCRIMVAMALNIVEPTELSRLDLLGGGHVSTEQHDLEDASVDFGRLLARDKAAPLAVFYPSSTEGVAQVVRAAHSRGFVVSARGHGHSINGQASASGGVVVKMMSTCASAGGGHGGGWGRAVVEEVRYVDVWGGELWIDVLRRTLEYGLAPRSWTDYLYLTVGGTLSNAGISGQAFLHGPQISNVYELDVVTGNGEVLTCSEVENSELFHAVLGGLGQFGIITRARIPLEPAPQMVRWIRLLYSDFSAFTADQEYLISLGDSDLKFDYVEGFVKVVDESLINNWRSSSFSTPNPSKFSSIIPMSNGDILYCLEVTKNYDEWNKDSVDQEVELLMENLNFIPHSELSTDVLYVDFLDRVHKGELNLRAKNLWDVPHPWLNLFVPKSRIADFDRGVFKGILGNNAGGTGPIIIYPMNKDKWDGRTSAVTPEEDVFYLVALLRTALYNGEETQSLDYLIDQNGRILQFCAEEGIEVKQYLPHYTSEGEWAAHFGAKWDKFRRNKMLFDTNHILGTGIFIQIFEEKAYLIGMKRKSGADDFFDKEESLKELTQLADTAGFRVVGSTYQNHPLSVQQIDAVDKVLAELGISSILMSKIDRTRNPQEVWNETKKMIDIVCISAVQDIQRGFARIL
ncbi:hypothetical protein SAY87_012579 [Trapa incisa]|uniref:cytokinin dehydrogenase n=1 Tax=Trapa incisa TaxID=236973 RepID=A0AAN7GTK9_9MYRT|nr:hypothetical protein SAY87_012579 [Trapa incisa]